jgi:hypothetical protein
MSGFQGMERPNTFTVPFQLPRCKWKYRVRGSAKCRKKPVSGSDYCELHAKEMELRKLGANAPLRVKKFAHRIARGAIERRRLVPQPCERCGKPPFDEAKVRRLVMAHHEDYTQPLQVNWLCRECHRARHKELGQDWLAEAQKKAVVTLQAKKLSGNL